MAYTYKFPRPSVTVDAVVFRMDDDALKVLLIQRGHPPHQGAWAFPGGFIEMDEDLKDAATRELREETGLKVRHLEQLHTYGAVDRDPRGRVITVAYLALVKPNHNRIKADDDARSAAWFNVDDVPKLAFDHPQVLAMALAELKTKARRQPIAFELLPAKFTLTQLQRVYELLLKQRFDKRNFRKKIIATEGLIELNEVQANVAHRAARLYRFDKKKCRQQVRQGIDFEI